MSSTVQNIKGRYKRNIKQSFWSPIPNNAEISLS